jgi:hypothetical protein
VGERIDGDGGLMVKLERIESGIWQKNPILADYRAEWLTDVLVERVTCGQEIALQPPDVGLRPHKILQPNATWVRFWFRREGWIVEKYFSAQGSSVGFYAPVCSTIDYHTGHLSADLFGLALWIEELGRVTVLGEESFDLASAEGNLSPVALEQAEHRVRELTTLTAQRRFPPAFVRNFGILTKP